MTYKKLLTYKIFLDYIREHNITEEQAVAHFFPEVGPKQVKFVFRSGRLGICYVYRGKLYLNQSVKEFNHTFEYEGFTTYREGIVLNVKQVRY